MTEQTQIQKEEEKSELQQEFDESIKEFVRAIQEEEEELERKRRILRKKGLVKTFAYHCNRCNYTWLPKDFDAITSDPLEAGSNIIREIPPKSCARCKSKQWNTSPTRKTKRNPDPKNPERWTIPRMKAEYRRCSRHIAEDDKRIKHLQEFAKKKGIRLT
jgi:hypothetical protein